MMDPQKFSSMELDAIAEVLNISLGSSATAVSNMLNRRVDITTPTVHVLPSEEFELGRVNPAVGVEITYVSGLSGRNIMLLRRQDVRAIVDILMGRETPDEEFVLDELSMSAICEVMNQMMGASATALSEFLGRMVNISTPTAFEVKNLEGFREDYFPSGQTMVVISFLLSIEGAMQSEFMNVMTCELAKELISALGLPSANDTTSTPPAPAAPAADSSGGTLSQEEIEKLMAGAAAPAAPQPAAEPASSGGTLSQDEIEKLMAGAAAPAAQPAPQPAPAAQPAASGGTLSQDEIEKLLAGAAQPQPVAQPVPQPIAQPVQQPVAAAPVGQTDAALLNQLTQLIALQQQQMQQMQQQQQQIQQMQQQQQQPRNKMLQADQPTMPAFASGESLGEEQAQNLDLIMSVPLEVSVEIGRTKRLVKDILGFTKGSLVVLDTLAGDQVNLFVNGQCVARGDVVVVEDNFGIRITEILQKPDLGVLTK